MYGSTTVVFGSSLGLFGIFCSLKCLNIRFLGYPLILCPLVELVPPAASLAGSDFTFILEPPVQVLRINAEVLAGLVCILIIFIVV